MSMTDELRPRRSPPVDVATIFFDYHPLERPSMVIANMQSLSLS